MAHEKFSKDRLFDEIYHVQEKVGHVPKQTEFTDHSSISVSPYYNRWDSWDEILRAAGLNPSERPSTRGKSDKDLIEDIQRVAEIVDRPPTTKQYNEHGKAWARTIADRFGSWEQGLEEAGLKTGVKKIPQKIGKKGLMNDLERLGDELGKRPTQREIDSKADYPSSKAYHRTFGSWSKALKEAGFEDPKYPTSREHGGWIPTSELFEELERVCKELGRGATRREFNSLSEYSERPFLDRLGSWVNALEAAGFDPKPVERLYGQDNPQYEGGSAADRYGPGWTESKKEKVRRRDDFTCQDPGCKMNQEQHVKTYGSALHVHHIEDPSRFESKEKASEPENLITLCAVHHPKWEQLQPLAPQGYNSEI